MAWVKAAEASDLEAGEGTVAEVSGRELALFNVDGEFFCIENECPHHAGPLGEGEVEGEQVMCPWHAWQINVRTGEVAHSPGVCVGTFPCKVEGGSVFVEV